MKEARLHSAVSFEQTSKKQRAALRKTQRRPRNNALILLSYAHSTSLGCAELAEHVAEMADAGCAERS